MKINGAKAELAATDNKITMSDIHSNRFAAPMQAQKPIARTGEEKNDG